MGTEARAKEPPPSPPKISPTRQSFLTNFARVNEVPVRASEHLPNNRLIIGRWSSGKAALNLSPNYLSSACPQRCDYSNAVRSFPSGTWGVVEKAGEIVSYPTTLLWVFSPAEGEKKCLYFKEELSCGQCSLYGHEKHFLWHHCMTTEVHIVSKAVLRLAEEGVPGTFCIKAHVLLTYGQCTSAVVPNGELWLPGKLQKPERRAIESL